jgi:hypothetical protein
MDFCIQFKGFYSIPRIFQEFSIGAERETAFETLLPLIRYGMLSPQKLFENVECNEHLKNVKCVKDLVFAAYRARVTGNGYQKRKYGSRSWTFAAHPTLGIGNALQVSEDGLTLTKPAVSQHATCLGNVEFEYGNVYYWEVTIKQFTSGINIGNKKINCGKFMGKVWFR